MTPESIRHEEALRRLHEHLGERVQCALSVELAGGGGGRPRSQVRVLKVDGVLTHPMSLETSDALPSEAHELFNCAYKIGGQLIVLPPMAGKVRGWNNGIEFAFAEGSTLSIMWGRPNADRDGQ